MKSWLGSQFYTAGRLLIAATLIFGLLLAVPATRTRADSPGFALAFDGANDSVRLAATAQMMASTWNNTKTIELWVRPEGAAVTCANNVVAACDYIFGDKPEWWGITRGIINGQDRIWVFNYDGRMDQVGVPYTAGEWIHIAMVHNSGALRVYRNGFEIATVASGATMQPNAGPVLYIGGVIFNSSRNYTLQGRIDEVRIWNIARSPAEIVDNMERLQTGSEAGLAAYYQMSNGAGNILTDDSVNNWNGTLLDGGIGVPPNGTYPQWVTSDAFGDSSPTPTNTPGSPTATPTFTNTPTSTSTSTNTPTPTWTPVGPTPTFTNTPTNTPTPTITNTPTNTPTPTHTNTPTSTSTSTNTPTPTWTPVGPTPTFTNTPTPTFTNTPTSTSTSTNTPTPTWTPVGPTPTFTNTPTPTATPSASAGFALAFDGVNDLVQLPVTSSTIGGAWTSAKSVELWVKPEGTAVTCANSNPGACDYIFGDRPQLWGITRGIINGQDRIWFFNFDGSMDLVGMTYTPNEWMHLALVHNGSTLKVYRNGVEAGSISSGATSVPGGANPVPYIGGIIYSSTRNYTMQGQIDEVRLWNIARSAAEVQNNIFTVYNGNEAGLAAYYRMSDGAGTILTDDSINSWNGSLLDGTSGVPPNGLPPQWVTSGAF